jgi:hypothetical protein
MVFFYFLTPLQFGKQASISYLYTTRSSVGIATDYGLDHRVSGVRFPAGLEIFLFSTASRPALEPTQTPSQWVPRVSPRR